MTPNATAVVTAVRALLTTQLAWQGTATELLHALAAADGTLALPDNARAIAAHLRGVAPLLRDSGIEVSFVRSGHAGTRTIHLAPLSAAYADATQLSANEVLTQAAAAFADSIATTATDTLTQTTVRDEAATSAEALTQVAPTPSLTFEQRIARWLDEHPEPSRAGLGTTRRDVLIKLPQPETAPRHTIVVEELSARA
jgi:hypothetical protein